MAAQRDQELKAHLQAFAGYIDEVLAKTDLTSPTAIARQAGLSASTINRPLKAARKGTDWPHYIELRTLRAIQRVSRIDPPRELIAALSAPGAESAVKDLETGTTHNLPPDHETGVSEMKHRLELANEIWDLPDGAVQSLLTQVRKINQLARRQDGRQTNPQNAG